MFLNILLSSIIVLILVIRLLLIKVNDAAQDCYFQLLKGPKFREEIVADINESNNGDQRYSNVVISLALSLLEANKIINKTVAKDFHGEERWKYNINRHKGKREPVKKFRIWEEELQPSYCMQKFRHLRVPFSC